MRLPDDLGRRLRLLMGAVAAPAALAAVFAAVVVPYRLWDSLAFGAWSRAIAAGGGILSSTDTGLFLQRPVFYVLQGLAWRVLDDEWVGRLLSLSFAALLAAAVWILAGRLSERAEARALLPPLALGVVLASAVVATYAASGMTDVPVAALVALTGAALWVERAGRAWVVLVGALAAVAVLTKPSALLAFAGLVPAIVLLRGRRAVPAVVGLGAGVVLALVYDAWQATRIDVSLVDLVTAGNDEFWRERGAAARWDALAQAEWLGGGLRLLVVFGLAHAVARAAGARPRSALMVGAAVAIVWSIAGPLVADGSPGYPFDGSVVGIVAWLALAGALIAAAFLGKDDPVPRRVHGALVLWLAPTTLAWAWQRADDVRHLAPSWAPFALATAAALASASIALARLRPEAVYAPAAALALLVVANIPSIDGLGQDGWRRLLDLGPSGWSDRAQMENYAYGPFSYELELARENVGPEDRIVTSNGRLTYFFPGQVDVYYARSCGDLHAARFFSFLTAGESLELAQREGQPTDPLGWIQCPEPHVELVGEQEGIYAAFVVGGPPSRASTAEDCRISSYEGEFEDAIFGERLSYIDAQSLVRKMEQVGYQGVKLERTGCAEFRVVVTGVPDDERVREEFRTQAASVGLEVTYAPAVRFPEVSPDVPPVE